ncbi:hypothetical protein GWI33_023191 [Rhynchophorus ferrugineus]|uniref:Uncharacterized protein n=1 Tax=Rhynchophorus ferrugineus TaxID=354439 RepID=A0A834MKP0_RHYFE|nr:hypothetical protein GWI33_023191 [Rhynchophorus ferrugineus]
MGRRLIFHNAPFSTTELPAPLLRVPPRRGGEGRRGGPGRPCRRIYGSDVLGESKIFTSHVLTQFPLGSLVFPLLFMSSVKRPRLLREQRPPAGSDRRNGRVKTALTLISLLIRVEHCTCTY